MPFTLTPNSLPQAGERDAVSLREHYLDELMKEDAHA